MYCIVINTQAPQTEYDDAPGQNHWRPLRAGLVVVSALGGQVVFATINMLLSPPPTSPRPSLHTGGGSDNYHEPDD